MKTRCFIIKMVVLLAMASCTPKDHCRDALNASPKNTASPTLSAIDSLMWQQPDSALMRLLPYFDTCIATEYNRHYAHLLLAELLYKNDSAQTNRAELQQAVAYFDSLVRQVSPPFKGAGGIKNKNSDSSTHAFLDARAHYINGVGYYENDSMVQACAEYLKTLEVMEERFGEKELTGHKARFMAYTYNRLGDMFSEQFMMESAITCYENALVYCRIEPTSPQGVSNTLYRIGKQYDKMEEIEKARHYYEQAIGEIPCSDILSYRDLVSSKALCDYQLGLGTDNSLNVLRQTLANADDEDERLTRFLTIGAIFAEEGIFDSAIYYLEPVLENEEDVVSQIQAAECLRIIYNRVKDNEKLNHCMRFLALQKTSEGQNKALVSKLEDMLKNYMNKKQEIQAEKERAKAVRKAVDITIPIAVAVAIAIIVLAKLRGKKLLKDKEKSHRQEMEAEQQTHKTQQAALSGRLKRSNEELRELKNQIRQQSNSVAKNEQAVSFTDEPICRLIMERVNKGQFLSQMDCNIYKDYALGKEQVVALREAADFHFNQFTVRLKKAYPELTHGDLDYCCLYLLGLNDADISALMQKAYPTVSQRSRKIKAIFGKEAPLSITLRDWANGNL